MTEEERLKVVKERLLIVKKGIEDLLEVNRVYIVGSNDHKTYTGDIYVCCKEGRELVPIKNV